jgi:PhnB protein
VTSIQPELWVESPSDAVAYYESAFGATVLHRVGDGDDIVLVVDHPAGVVRQAVSAGATESSPRGDEQGWRIGRIVDPFGHEWEIGRAAGGVAAVERLTDGASGQG